MLSLNAHDRPEASEILQTELLKAAAVDSQKELMLPPGMSVAYEYFYKEKGVIGEGTFGVAYLVEN
jgi:hypothetical protein